MYGARGAAGTGRGGSVAVCGPEPADHRVATWTLSITAIIALAVAVAVAKPSADFVASLLPWLGLCLAADAMTVDLWRDLHFTMSFPVLLACGMSLGPLAAAMVGFAGCFDRREFRREVGPARALSNRAQVAISAAAGASAYRALGGSWMAWPWVLVATLIALCVDGALNAAFVSVFAGLLYREPPMLVARRLILGRPWQFALAYVCCGLLALQLACSFRALGVWGLVIGATPLFLAGQMLAHARRLVATSQALAASRRLLAEADDRVVLERTDERRQIAAALHDDVLQCLHYLTLTAQVIREDLRHGRLFQLEEDIPGFVQVCLQLGDLVRAVITDLRASPLGRHGAGHALAAHAAQLQEQFRGEVRVHLDEIPADAGLHTVVYRIGREALNNAIRHSGADVIVVTLAREDAGTRLTVTDDGRGFRTEDPAPDGHFGLTFMRENAGRAGGAAEIRSAPGLGTTVEAWFPA